MRNLDLFLHILVSFLSFVFFLPASHSAQEKRDRTPHAPLQGWPSMMSLIDISDDATPESLARTLEGSQPSGKLGISLTDYP